MSKLILMVGIPGSGKSTWVKNHLTENDVVVSRDEVRFSIIGENDEYFSKENQVFAEFCRQINENLKAGKNVFADATHLNELSRRKLLNGVRGYKELEAVVLSTVCEEALKRNSNREGTRSFVPESVIKRMSSQFVFPDLSEGFSTIYSVTPDKPIVVVKGVK